MSNKTALTISVSTLNTMQVLGAGGKKIHVGTQADGYDLSDSIGWTLGKYTVA